MDRLHDLLRTVETHNPILAPIVFIIVRASAVVVPPIPGITIDLVGIAMFGWWRAFLYAEIGIMCGALIAFFLARSVREHVLRFFVPLKQVHSWRERLSPNVEFWGLVLLRLATNPAFDYISYASGLSGVGPRRFASATLIGNIPSVFVVFYFGGLALGQSIYVTLVCLLVVFVVYLVCKRLLMSRLLNSIDRRGD